MEPRTGEDGGVVRVWYDEEGWGVVDCPSTRGGCSGVQNCRWLAVY